MRTCFFEHILVANVYKLEIRTKFLSKKELKKLNFVCFCPCITSKMTTFAASAH